MSRLFTDRKALVFLFVASAIFLTLIVSSLLPFLFVTGWATIATDLSFDDSHEEAFFEDLPGQACSECDGMLSCLACLDKKIIDSLESTQRIEISEGESDYILLMCQGEIGRNCSECFVGCWSSHNGVRLSNVIWPEDLKYEYVFKVLYHDKEIKDGQFTFQLLKETLDGTTYSLRLVEETTGSKYVRVFKQAEEGHYRLVLLRGKEVLDYYDLIVGIKKIVTDYTIKMPSRSVYTLSPDNRNLRITTGDTINFSVESPFEWSGKWTIIKKNKAEDYDPLECKGFEWRINKLGVKQWGLPPFIIYEGVGISLQYLFKCRGEYDVQLHLQRENIISKDDIIEEWSVTVT